MKKDWNRPVCAVIMIMLLCCFFSSTLAETETDKINAIYAAVKKDKIPILAGEAVPYGRLLVAVYEDGAEDTPRLSSEEMDEAGYHGIPANMLAPSLSEAQTLILLYPTEKSKISGADIFTTVCVVDLLQESRYKTWMAGSKYKSNQPAIKLSDGLTVGGPGDVSMDVDKAMASVLNRISSASDAANEALYKTACQHFDEELFYTASLEFRQSLWNDWNERRAACIQPWPENGEVWKKGEPLTEDVPLDVRVKQPEDNAMFIRFYLEGEAYSGLFIGGTGKAKIILPAGVYSMKAGTGSLWYGGREMFGKDGYYETFTFDAKGSEAVELKTGYAYVLTIYVDKSEGESTVGSVDEIWENVRE